MLSIIFFNNQIYFKANHKLLLNNKHINKNFIINYNIDH